VSPLTSQDCLLSDVEDAPDSTVLAGSYCISSDIDQVNDAIVFSGELGAAEVAPGFGILGWIVLRVRRHAKRLTSLDAGDLETSGLLDDLPRTSVGKIRRHVLRLPTL